jgi:ABC-type antimicrobial peptide transport system permease subunit
VHERLLIVSVLQRSSPTILVSCAGVGTLLGVVGGLLPALRASRIDPIRALRG